jgi:hypothetical protein
VSLNLSSGPSFGRPCTPQHTPHITDAFTNVICAQHTLQTSHARCSQILTSDVRKMSW